MLLQQQRKIQRHEQILSSLDELNYATLEQLRLTNNLGGNRNAHRILSDIEKEGTIKSFRYERKIYFLSNQGKEQIGSSQEDLKKSQITHALMRNDLYIKMGMPAYWQKEVPIRFNEVDNFLISDATFNEGNKFFFVEIDNKQTMRTNSDKIERYGRFFKAMYQHYGEHPTLIWYTLSEVKKNKLSEACKKAGIKFSIY